MDVSQAEFAKALGYERYQSVVERRDVPETRARLTACFVMIWLACLFGGGNTVLLAQLPSPALSGRVVDADTGAPIELAHVFVDGTTLGDVTAADGSFHLTLPETHQFRVVVSMLGYQIESVNANRNTVEPIEIQLKPGLIWLDELTVEVERSRQWTQNLEQLKRLLFSTTPGGRSCVIDNPEVLELSSEARDGPLLARARAPLVISNRTLGYRVTLHAFTLEGSDRVNKWQGRTYFEELIPESERQRQRWEERRRQAYAGSLRHFLHALTLGRLPEAGFEAYLVGRPSEVSEQTPVLEMGVLGDSGTEPIWPDELAVDVKRPRQWTRILYPAEDEATRTLKFSGALYVRYRHEREPRAYHVYLRRYAGYPRGVIFDKRYQSSWLELPFGEVAVDTLGNVVTWGDSFPLTRYGYWAWERLGEMLPFDYRPRG